MAATFVRWNPELNPDSGLALRDAARYTDFDSRENPHSDRKYLMDWSVREPGQTSDGDDVFMFVWGNTGMVGLLGYGTIAGSQFLNPNWRDPNLEPMPYVPILWTCMLQPEQAIPAADVLAALPNGQWPGLNSGEVLPAGLAEPLVELLVEKKNEARFAARRLNQKLIEAFPELLPFYQEAIESEGEDAGSHAVYAHTLVPRIEELVRLDDTATLQPYLDYMEGMLLYADDYIVTVGQVTVLGGLYHSDLDRDKIRPLLGVESARIWGEYEELEAQYRNTKFDDFDVVKTLVTKGRISQGSTGVIIDTLTNPSEAYIVEFNDDPIYAPEELELVEKTK